MAAPWVKPATSLTAKLAPRTAGWAIRSRTYRTTGALRVLDLKLRHALKLPAAVRPPRTPGPEIDGQVARLALAVGMELDKACLPLPPGKNVPKKGWLASSPDKAKANALAVEVQRALRP